MQSLIIEKKAQENLYLRKYVDSLGPSVTKRQHYKLFRHVDQSQIKNVNNEHYSLKEFERKPRLVTKDETKVNPIFGILEQDQKLSLVPRKAL